MNERKKLPTEVDLNSLLESLNNDDGKEQIIDYHNDIVPFLSKYEIKPGEHLLKRNLLYKLYRLYSKDPRGLQAFSIEVNKYLVQICQGRTEYYKINQDSFKLSEEVHRLLQKPKRDFTKSPVMKKHFEQYMGRFELKPGNYWIEGYLLYLLYDGWYYQSGRKAPIGYKNFIKLCRLYFKSERITANRVTWFAVDEQLLQHVTQDRIASMREKRKEFYGKKKKKTNKTPSK